MITGAVMSIVIGRLADIFGAKKMFLVVMVCYTAGISLAPFSPDISTLLALRVVQGVVVAVIPLSAKMVRDVYPDEKFVQAQGILTSMFSVGSVIGLVVGAVVLQYIGWQGIFYTTIPFSIIVTILSLKFLPSHKLRPRIVAPTAKAFENKDNAQGPKKSDSDKGYGLEQLDIKDAITLSVGLVSLLLALSFAPFIYTLFIDFIISLIVGSVSMGLFVIIQGRAAVPLVDLKVMSHKVIVLGNIALLVYGIVQYLIFQAIPILGQSPASVGGFDLSAIGVGILQLPFSIAIVVLGPIAGIIAAKYGATKLLIPSAATILLSFVLLVFLHSTPEQVGINLIFFGIGTGLFVTLDAVIILFIPKAVMGTSAAVMNTLRIIGGAIGPIISGTIMQIFLVQVTVDGEEQLFPSVVAFNLIFFICMILGIVLTIAVVLMRSKVIKVSSASSSATSSISS
jgi:MFS family permease